MSLAEKVSTRGTIAEVDLLKSYSTQDIFSLFLDYSQNHGYPMAAWRLPEDNVQHMILDLSGVSKKVETDLENLPPGFLFSAFDNDFSLPNAQADFINADLHFDSQSRQINLPNRQTASEKAAILRDSMLDRLKNGNIPSLDHSKRHLPNGSTIHPQEKDHFLKMVRSAVQEVRAQKFKKVVPSRCSFVPLPDDFNLAETFEKMCARYPHAFISLLAVPGLGMWLGASPEILVSTFRQNGSRFFRTIALAGTQKLEDGNSLQQAAWRIKEIEEQAMVSRYIINCFKKIRLREFEEDGPKTVSAGNLLHLRTDFSVNMDQVNFAELGSVMLKLLHPTSAVCGLSKEPALNFIRQHEDYDRELYAGFLGPVNMNDQANIFVNLRCMQLTREGALLYAGAGVTADSDPEKEWQETEMKMQTLQRVLI